MKKNLVIATVLFIAFGLTACSSSQASGSGNSGSTESSAKSETEQSVQSESASTDDGGSSKTEISYSKSAGPYSVLLEEAIQPILEAQGYTVTAYDMGDLATADIVLNQGDVDFNVEQHTAYINNFNKSQGGDLVPICPIPTVPAGVYSAHYESIDDIFDGAKVAVPNDASNTARCYLMLQKAGWITIDPDADQSTITSDDIIENPYNIEFTEMTSSNIPPVMEDFDFVAITGSIVYNAGIDSSTALINEDIQDHLVLQVTVKKENADTEWAKAIVAAYHSDEFKDYMEKTNAPGGEWNALWWIPDELK